MNVTDAIAAVENKLLEDSDESDLFDAAQIRKFIYEANRIVWLHAVKVYPIPWEARSADLPVASRAKLSYSDLGAGVKLHKVTYLELKNGEEYVPVWPVNKGDRWRYDFFSVPEILAYRWYPEGLGLYLTPANIEAVTARVTYVPVIAEPADNGELLGGAATEYHDTVVTKAAILAYGKDENLGPAWRKEYDEQLGLLKMGLVEQQGQESRRVHSASDY